MIVSYEKRSCPKNRKLNADPAPPPAPVSPTRWQNDYSVYYLRGGFRLESDPHRCSPPLVICRSFVFAPLWKNILIPRLPPWSRQIYWTVKNTRSGSLLTSTISLKLPWLPCMLYMTTVDHSGLLFKKKNSRCEHRRVRLICKLSTVVKET